MFKEHILQGWSATDDCVALFLSKMDNLCDCICAVSLRILGEDPLQLHCHGFGASSSAIGQTKSFRCTEMTLKK